MWLWGERQASNKLCKLLQCSSQQKIWVLLRTRVRTKLFSSTSRTCLMSLVGQLGQTTIQCSNFLFLLLQALVVAVITLTWPSICFTVSCFSYPISVINEVSEIPAEFFLPPSPPTPQRSSRHVIHGGGRGPAHPAHEAGTSSHTMERLQTSKTPHAGASTARTTLEGDQSTPKGRTGGERERETKG